MEVAMKTPRWRCCAVIFSAACAIPAAALAARYTITEVDTSGALVGDARVYASGINAAGHVTGNASGYYASDAAYLFDGTRHDLPITGATATAAAINDSDQIVGSSSVRGDFFIDRRAFLYDGDVPRPGDAWRRRKSARTLSTIWGR